MAAQTLAYYALNRGLVSRLGLARADVKRLAIAAEINLNYVPRVLGSMMLRPGLEYLDSTLDDLAARFIPFVFSPTDKALIEFTEGMMRVWVDDTPITRAAVTSAITNGTFATNVTSWTCTGGTTWQDGTGSNIGAPTGGYMGILSNGSAIQSGYQAVAVPVGSVGVEHALRITIERGPVTLLVGSTAGADDYIGKTALEQGVHSLTFTPTGTFYVQFESTLDRYVLIDSVAIESAGAMEIPAPWQEADLDYIRYDQSADVVYVGAKGFQQRKIERRSTTSWSIVLYSPENGPFRTANVSAVTITPSGLTGNITLTASAGSQLFSSALIRALFRLTSSGQTTTKSMTALNDATPAIEVTGAAAADRTFSITLTGLTATGNTVVLQRSAVSSTGPWSDVATMSWTADVSTTFSDGLDNQIIYYRLLCSVYAAGTTVATLQITAGSIDGIVRITSVASSVSATAEVLSPLGATTATDNWAQELWSGVNGWPSAPALYEGRLWWGGNDRIVGSESDGFESFNDLTEGDSAPISRSIGSGPVETINWLLPLQRLILGGQMAEFSCRSSAFDEPLTPTNFNIKDASTQGSAPVGGVKIDKQGIYVQRGGFRVYALDLSAETYDYTSTHLSALVPSIGKPGIVRIAVQRQPDTRVHFVRSDGTVAMLIFDKLENVTCWVEIESPAADGEIEDVVVLPSGPGEEEDHVYYVVKRTINGSTKRYLEKWATEEQCRGLDDAGAVTDLCRLADSFMIYQGPAMNVISGLDHIEGEEVVVWADGADVGHDDDDANLYTVTAGQITLPSPYSNVVVGLPYTAQWRSGKMVQLAGSMKKEKNIAELGMILADTHRKGVKFGQDFDNMNDLPGIEGGAPVSANAVREALDGEAFIFPGTWAIDSRICLESIAPRPFTALAIIATVDA